MDDSKPRKFGNLRRATMSTVPLRVRPERLQVEALQAEAAREVGTRPVDDLPLLIGEPYLGDIQKGEYYRGVRDTLKWVLEPGQPTPHYPRPIE